jgi:D-amino-acid dehydrogenase
MPDVLVLGAGMVGVSTALALQAVGRDVVLIDRKAPGRETSYGNVGIIQSEAVEPYALPRDIPSLTRIALKRGNGVNYHFNALPSYVRPLWLYYWFSAPERHKVISRATRSSRCARPQRISRSSRRPAPMRSCAGRGCASSSTTRRR